jgi:hypothetical protein
MKIPDGHDATEVVISPAVTGWGEPGYVLSLVRRHCEVGQERPQGVRALMSRFKASLGGEMRVIIVETRDQPERLIETADAPLMTLVHFVEEYQALTGERLAPQPCAPRQLGRLTMRGKNRDVTYEWIQQMTKHARCRVCNEPADEHEAECQQGLRCPVCFATSAHIVEVFTRAVEGTPSYPGTVAERVPEPFGEYGNMRRELVIVLEGGGGDGLEGKCEHVWELLFEEKVPFEPAALWTDAPEHAWVNRRLRIPLSGEEVRPKFLD